jgi:hypothetical protein
MIDRGISLLMRLLGHHRPRFLNLFLAPPFCELTRVPTAAI